MFLLDFSFLHIKISIIFYFVLFVQSEKLCHRFPTNVQTDRSPNIDNNFILYVTGNPHTYILDEIYNVTLQANNGHQFIGAKLALEYETTNGFSNNVNLGEFEIVDFAETRYSPNCKNMIESTNGTPKTHLSIQWRAPKKPGNGCILIRGTVLRHRDIWHMDDGGLTKRICEEIIDLVESTNIQYGNETCCACDEARYELSFNGLWSRNLHPKDFPSNSWRTGFSAIIGVTHTSSYRFWKLGQSATPAMREFVEHGSSKSLEYEFNRSFQEGSIRTIVRARSMSFPYLNKPSMSAIRVDPLHHQLSVATRIDPSPDWFVGVTGLELCLPNCTWLEDKLINLYPWDAGTDAGFTYTSPDQPQIPPDVIRRIGSDMPKRSPFFYESGLPMKPLATLRVHRQRIYERKCQNVFSNEANIPNECQSNSWSMWSECSSTCGEGFQTRRRIYENPIMAKIFNCDAFILNKEERSCFGQNCSQLSFQALNNIDKVQKKSPLISIKMNDDRLIQHRKTNDADCQLSSWSTWSKCNKSCGNGIMTRQRHYLNSDSEIKCQDKHFSKLHEYKRCFGIDCSLSTNLIDKSNEKHIQILSKFNEKLMKVNRTEKQYNVMNLDVEYNNNTFNNGNVSKQKEKEKEKERKNFESSNLYDSTNQMIQNTNESNYHHPVYHLIGENNHDVFNNISTVFDDINRNAGRYLKRISDYCYYPLNIVQCPDSRVTDNFWFYNVCHNECMLYAADSCDHNDNRFTSLEKCEIECRQPIGQMGIKFLKQKQNIWCHQKTKFQ